MDSLKARALASALIITSLAIIYADYYYASQLSIPVRLAIGIADLLVTGIIIQKALSLQGGYGLYMVGSTKGIATIDGLSKKHLKFWDAMAMWGLVLGFGLLAYPLLKGRIDKRIFAFGILSLIFILVVVSPNLVIGLQFINLPQIQNVLPASSSSIQVGFGTNPISIVYDAIVIIGGFSGLIFMALAIGAESILYGVVQYITSPSAATAASLTNQIGVAPVLPGITIPFIAGIVSLAVLLTIHEFSHGVLARIFKIKLKSIGVVLFGSIPLGAYVEPDEKMVGKLDKLKQTKIFSAGISANFIATIAFFALTAVLLTYVLPSIYQYKVLVTGTSPNYPANGVLQAGMQILKWNNYTIKNLSSLAAAGSMVKPNSTVTVLTDKGQFSFRAVKDPNNQSRGLIGVFLGYRYEPVRPSLYASIIYFLFTVFALSMILNFFVGAFNLLPLPGLDGWRIYFANLKNERITKTVGALLIILILINLLPLLLSVV